MLKPSPTLFALARTPGNKVGAVDVVRLLAAIHGGSVRLCCRAINSCGLCAVYGSPGGIS